jgi:membrane protein DedA with SNARE-associated domain
MHALLLAPVAAGFLYDVFHNVEHGFATYGYLLVFVPILLECAGIPLPGETVLLAAGVEAQRGNLSLPLVILTAAAAAIIGDNLGYLVGRKGGRYLLFRYGRILRVKDRHIALLDSYFERHGPKTVLFGRWVAFLRVWAALFAGASRMHWRTFFVYNAAGGIAWATTIACVAYAFSASAKAIGSAFGIFGWVLALAVAVAVTVFVLQFERRASIGGELDGAIEKVRREREQLLGGRAGGGAGGGGAPKR